MSGRKSNFAAIFNAANDDDSLSLAQPNLEGGQWIYIDKIIPGQFQPRQYFDETEINNLAKSFKTHGFRGVINVRPKNDEYELVAGERRWRAAQKAGIDKILCLVDDFSDEEALQFALIENLKRVDLSKLEETLGILKLIEARYGIPQKQAVTIIRTEGHPDSLARCGVTPSQELQNIMAVLQEFNIELQTFRTRNLRSLDLPNDVKRAHLEGKLSWSATLEIQKIKNEEERENLLQEVLSGGISSYRDIQTKVKEVKSRLSERNEIFSHSSFQERLKLSASKIKKVEKKLDSKKRKRIEKLLLQLEEILSDPNIE